MCRAEETRNREGRNSKSKDDDSDEIRLEGAASLLRPSNLFEEVTGVWDSHCHCIDVTDM